MSPWRWARREWQHHGAGHALIVLTLALGVAGLFLIGKLKAGFLLSLHRQERELLSSDFALTARRPLAEGEIQALLDATVDTRNSHYRVVDMSSMLYVPAKETSRLVEVRVVEPGFPFYGRLEGQAGPIALTDEHPLFRQDCMLVSQELQRLLDLSPHDELKLGEARLRICGVVVKDPTQGLRGFSLAPRAYLARSRLEATGLLGFGSIATHAFHVRFKDGAPPASELKARLAKLLPDPVLRLRTPRDESEQTARSGQLLGDYLQLVSLVALLLAVVGCFYLFRSLLHRRLKDMAVLRALGTGGARLRALFLFPLAVDFFAATGLALLLSQAARPLTAKLLGGLFGAEFPMVAFPAELLFQLPLLFLLVMVGLAPALEEALRVPVRVLLQDQEQVPAIPWRSHLAFLLLELGLLFLLAGGVTRSPRTAGIFVGGLVAVVFFLAMGAWAGRWLLARGLSSLNRLNRPGGLLAGLTLRRVVRRPVPTFLTLLALGLGGTLLSFLSHLEMSLGREFTVAQGSKPSLFLFDIQDEQVDPLKAFLAQQSAPVLAFTPMVRGKLVELGGRPYRREDPAQDPGLRSREEEDNARFRQRMMNLTWESVPNPSTSLVEGVSLGQATVPDGEFPVSLEERFAGRVGAKLGDQLVFEVLGVPVTGRVVNLRSVKWTSFLPNFFITFAPGALEDAPKSWLAAVGPLSPQHSAQLQNGLAQRFANISAIDVAQLVGRIQELFQRMRQALSFMAVFAFGVGVVVVGAIAQDQLLRRKSEVMLEKVLGIPPWQVFAMVWGEYVVLALIALSWGGLGGALLAAILTVQVFQGAPVWDGAFIALLVSGGTLVTSLPLLFSIRKIFFWRPAGLLQSP